MEGVTSSSESTDVCARERGGGVEGVKEISRTRSKLTLLFCQFVLEILKVGKSAQRQGKKTPRLRTRALLAPRESRAIECVCWGSDTVHAPWAPRTACTLGSVDTTYLAWLRAGLHLPIGVDVRGIYRRPPGVYDDLRALWSFMTVSIKWQPRATRHPADAVRWGV